MNTMQIKSPKSNRTITVRAWDIDPRAVLASFKSGELKSARDLSWKLLNEKGSVAAMGREMDGEAASSNFALSVFENALDWSLGLKVLAHIRGAVAVKRMPKPFKVAASRGGDVFIIGASGTVYA